MTAADKGAGDGPGDGPGARAGELVAGKYRLERRIGTGGMGEVYEARHTVIGRRFAIKLLLPEYARKPDMLARFQREAQAAGALESEHVVAVTDIGVTADGAPYLLMEFLEGEDLRRALGRAGPLPVGRAVDLAMQACRGLAVAHRAGIVHRDVKPENLFLLPRSDGGERLKILDFGIAKLRDSAETAGPAVSAREAGGGSTRSGLALGTPSYMSPEQARGEREIDQRSDVYSLGVILYEMLGGRRPHQGDGYNAVIFQILTRVPEPLGSLRPGLPAGLAEVVATAMAFDRRSRYASASDLGAALAPFASAARASDPAAPAPSARPRASARVVTAPAPGSGAHQLAGVARVRRARPRRRWSLGRAPLLAAVAAGMAIAAAVVLSSWSRGADGGRRPPPPPVAMAPAIAAPTPPPPPRAELPSASPPPSASPRAAAAALPAASAAPPPASSILGAARRGDTTGVLRRAGSAPRPARSRAAVPSSAASLEFDSRNPYDD